MEVRSDSHPPPMLQAQRSYSTQMDYPVQFMGRDAVPPVKIFYHPSMEGLASGIVNLAERAKLTTNEVSPYSTGNFSTILAICKTESA